MPARSSSRDRSRRSSRGRPTPTRAPFWTAIPAGWRRVRRCSRPFRGGCPTRRRRHRAAASPPAVRRSCRSARKRRRQCARRAPGIGPAATCSRMADLLDVDGLTVRYRVGSALLARLTGTPPTITAVADVSMTVDAGSGYGLVGESGSGKSTLGRAIMGLVPAAAGEIRIGGDRLPAGGAAPRSWCRQVALTFQDPVGSLSPRLPVRTLIGEPFRIHGLAHRDPRAEVRRLADLVGLDAALL